MAKGLSNRAIGDRLFLSPTTVEGHMRTIYGKLGLSRAEGDHRRVLAVLHYVFGAAVHPAAPEALAH